MCKKKGGGRVYHLFEVGLVEFWNKSEEVEVGNASHHDNRAHIYFMSSLCMSFVYCECGFKFLATYLFEEAYNDHLSSSFHDHVLCLSSLCSRPRLLTCFDLIGNCNHNDILKNIFRHYKVVVSVTEKVSENVCRVKMLSL